MKPTELIDIKDVKKAFIVKFGNLPIIPIENEKIDAKDLIEKKSV